MKIISTRDSGNAVLANESSAVHNALKESWRGADERLAARNNSFNEPIMPQDEKNERSFAVLEYKQRTKRRRKEGAKRVARFYSLVIE